MKTHNIENWKSLR